MALLRQDVGEKVPPSFVKCSEEEALEYHATLIKNWTPPEDVWAFKVGPPLFTSSAALSAVYITDRFRKKFNLNKASRVALLFPAVITPVIVLPIFHYKLVTEKILLQNTCPLCVGTRAAALQVGLGIVYPLLIAPIASSVLAYTFVTTRLPDLTWKNAPAYYELCKKVIRPKRNIIVGLGIFNVLLSMFMVDGQARNIFRVGHILEQRIAEEK